MTKALRLLFCAFLTLAVVVGTLSQRVSASQTISAAFLTDHTGVPLQMTLSGQPLCQVTLNQQAPGTIITAQGSKDGVAWVPITTIGNGAIFQTGVYLGNVDSVAYPLFRLFIVSLTGTISGNVVCGDSVPIPLYNGQSGGAVAQIIAGNCTSPNPGIGNAAVDYICPTPNALHPGVCTSPRATGVNGVAIDFTCTAPATANPFESTLAQRSDILHWWTLHAATSAGGSTPGPCSTTPGAFVDTPATASASPVPLVVATISGQGPPTCKWPDILPNNGASSTAFCWAIFQQGCNVTSGGTASYLQIPAEAQTACFATTPYTIFAIVRPVVTSRNEAFYQRDPQDSLVFLVQDQEWYTLINNGAHNVAYATGPAFFVYTNDGTTSSTFINGSPITQPTVVPSAAPTGLGAIGNDVPNNVSGFMGAVEDVGCANTLWSLPLVQYLYTLTGL